jgi:ELWxxDGT repeat protein
MKRAFITLLSIAIPFVSVQAQEVSFEQVNLLAQPGERVDIRSPGVQSGDRMLQEVAYLSADGTYLRAAMLGIKGTDVQYLFNPYRDSQPPYFTDVKPLPYKNKAVVSIRNVGPGGVDSIWITDGTTAGTREIANVDPGASPFIINDSLVLIKEDSEVNFVDLTSGAVIHIADGVTDGSRGYSSRIAGDFPDGRGLFIAGKSLYVSDGTAAGTQVLKTLSQYVSSYYGITTPDASDPSPLRAFAIEHGLRSSTTTYVTDGTVAGTREIPLSTYQIVGDEVEQGIVGIQFGNKVIYNHTTTDYGRELWSLDLVTLQASVLKDINPGPTGSRVNGAYGSFKIANRKLFFVADDGTHGAELWVTDGTLAGTSLTKDIAPGSLPGLFFSFDYPAYPTIGQYFVFMAQPNVTESTSTNAPQNLWASDGTAEGTFQLLNSQTAIYSGSAAVNDEGVLVTPSSEQLGIKLSDGRTMWDHGVFLRFFDPSLGPPTSAQLVTIAGSTQLVNGFERFHKFGEYYYFHIRDYTTNQYIILSASRQLCPGSDFKLIPGQCGCGVEELPADSGGGIAPTNSESDGSAVCLTPIGPIFIPSSLTGAISGQLSQKAGQADSVQLTIPASIQNALQAVTTAPNINVSGRSAPGEVMTMKTPSFKVQHVVSVVVLDKRSKTTRKIPMRKTSTGTLKIKLGRRLTSNQRLAFQYAVTAGKNGRQLVQTPYKKSGAIKLTKARR